MERVGYLMYKIVATKGFLKSLRKLDKGTQKLIKKYIENNLQNAENPKAKGKPLKYDLSAYWRYRIGDYRLICEIDDDKVIVILIDVGHRRDVYD